VLAKFFESVWAIALGESRGFRRWVPALIFAVALIVSMAGLAWAGGTIAIGTAYAAWAGVGAALHVGYAMVSGVKLPGPQAEPRSATPAD
jgi:quaternary ammonium compound-resistance protein SugE